MANNVNIKITKQPNLVLKIDGASPQNPSGLDFVNQGGGAGIYKDTIGSTVELKTLTNISNKIVLTQNTNTIDIDINESNLAISSEITSINTSITSINSQISTINSEITSINSQLSSQASSISTINSEITAINSSISSINTQLSSNTTSINTINTEITAINTSLTNLQNQINKLDILTAKGDLLTFDGTNYQKLAVGTDGQVLSADSTQPKGIKWTTPASASVTSVNTKTGAVVLDKTDIGLANVDNTSDLNKPISTATQTALNNKVDKVTGMGLSTNDYTNAEKTKLAGLSNYTLPIASSSILGGIQVGSGLSIAGDGTLSVSYSYTLPIASGTTLGGIKVGSGLSIDGSGVLSATTSGGTPAGSNYQVQWNNSGVFGASSNFTVTTADKLFRTPALAKFTTAKQDYQSNYFSTLFSRDRGRVMLAHQSRISMYELQPYQASRQIYSLIPVIGAAAYDSTGFNPNIVGNITAKTYNSSNSLNLYQWFNLATPSTADNSVAYIDFGLDFLNIFSSTTVRKGFDLVIRFRMHGDRDQLRFFAGIQNGANTLPTLPLQAAGFCMAGEDGYLQGYSANASSATKFSATNSAYCNNSSYFYDPSNSGTPYVYELRFSSNNDNTLFSCSLTNTEAPTSLGIGSVAEIYFDAGAVGGNYPDLTQLYRPFIGVSNGVGTGANASLDIISIYLEITNG